MGEIRIPELTDAHRESFPAFIDEWTAVGRSCDPMDRKAAGEGVTKAYAAAGLAAPQVFFAASPVGGAIMRQIILDRLVRAGVGEGVWAGVRDGVRAGVREGVREGVWDGVRAGVGDGVGAGVWDGVRAGVWDGVRDDVGDGWQRECWWGQHDAGWLSFYNWFAQNGLADICAPLEGLTLLARSAGWCWFHQGFTVISDRPELLHDETVTGHRRALHCADGPAVTYRDGWSVWAWHGTNVPQWVIENPTIDKIQAETNTEVRRCAIESYGWAEYLAAIGATPVDEADDPGNPGHRLRLYDTPEQVYDTPTRLLVMDNASLDRDGTRRMYAETVPADIGDAVSAAAWQFDIAPDTYRRLERAT